ncbi:WXG100 family type VII secretion target [Arthrobacter sp. CJ23]|uniref:WXG100 family type VII secretion target n=1 Tax=Arthrobacter sp. CJ23 TaxID=2972479 RepID=UPI00215C6179|nr:hypothetical protein [Arthrobacter sp. CJ23]UVJ39247.1 hypothetical protein NVV90_18920 [Arthrobacter sp. CJ23]
MAFYGADIEQLRLLSKSLSTAAELLSSKARELDSLITQSGYWQGHDAKAFAAEWQSRLRPLIENASRGVADASRTAMSNAEEQSSASADGGGSSTSSNTGSSTGSTPESGLPADSQTVGQTTAVEPSSDRPSPQEILDKYQVSDAKTTKWPSDWDPLRLVVDQRRVTEKEAELLNGLGPLEMNAFKGIHDDAFSVADERFPSPDQNDDQNDAFRHAYWNALMVKEYGAEWAEDYATAHEQLPGNPAPREAMDLYNNEVGRNVAIAHPDASAEELADLIEQAVKNGDTVVVGQDLLPHPSNEIPMDQTGDANDAAPAPGHNPDFNDESRTTS